MAVNSYNASEHTGRERGWHRADSPLKVDPSVRQGVAGVRSPVCSFFPDFLSYCLPICVIVSARCCGKFSRHPLRADLGPKGFVGGKGSPPRNAHEAIQVSPHFFLRSKRLISLSRCASLLGKRLKLVTNKPSPVWVALTTSTCPPLASSNSSLI